MTTFKSEILARLDILKTEKKLDIKRKKYSKTYLGSADEENGSEIAEFNDFQIAFIDLFEEKNSQLVEQFQEVLETQLKEIVEPDDLSKINLDEDVGFYNLIIPQQGGSDEWSIELATSFDETIFHVFFTGWKFENLGLTH